jgi:short-subunit dehydrogenase
MFIYNKRCIFQSVISFLSEGVDRERNNIRVQCLTPALVATNMTLYKDSTLFVTTPEYFAKCAIATIGLVTKTSGCFNHEIQVIICQHFLSSVFVSAIIASSVTVDNIKDSL